MCGIVGVRRSWLAGKSRFDAALQALTWRGPDGARALDVGPFSLGVSRLAITDPTAAQPIVDPDTGCAIALNGALTSARDEWPRFAARARTRNDAELLLLRYLADGPSALLAQTGHYAFALVDPRDGSLWLGRDPEGEKPLYIAHDDESVVVVPSRSLLFGRPDPARSVRTDRIAGAANRHRR